MTDNEILKALECHSETSYNQNACERCPILNHCDCGGKMAQNALDLINRQRAKIERLKKENEYILMQHEFQRRPSGDWWNDAIKKAKSEAIKEFATALKTYRCIPMAARGYSYVNCEVIDELVQEMNEIVKAFDCCENGNCDEDCPFFFDRGNCYNLDDYVIDLIKRQKAEIESLKDSIQYGNEICENCQGDKNKGLKNARKNAIKEFAERLKEQKYQSSDWSHGEHPFVVEESDIDELVQEMVGDENETL